MIELSDTEKTLYDFIKKNGGTVTIKKVIEELGEKFVGGLGRLVRNEIAKTTKVRVENEDKYVKSEKAIELIKEVEPKKESYVINCLIKCTDDDSNKGVVLFQSTEDGLHMITKLDGYAIIPKEEYYKLTRKTEEEQTKKI